MHCTSGNPSVCSGPEADSGIVGPLHNVAPHDTTHEAHHRYVNTIIVKMFVCAGRFAHCYRAPYTVKVLFMWP